MSWFYLKAQGSRRKRKGIWIRPYLNPEVMKAIKRTNLMRPSDTVQRIVICELRPDNQVLLEVWCTSLVDSARGKHRNNVFHFIIDEDPEWICEGDLGRGL